jgi:hypothetical protein
MLALSLQDVKDEADRRKQAEEAQHLGLERKRRPTYLQVVVAAGGLLALVLLGLNFHLGQPVQTPQIILNPNNSMGLLTRLQFVLELYAAAHHDRYPGRLYDLLPDFLADNEQNRKVLGNLVYKLDARNGYLLRIKESAPFSGKELVATAEDIEATGEELSQ